MSVDQPYFIIAEDLNSLDTNFLVNQFTGSTNRWYII